MEDTFKSNNVILKNIDNYMQKKDNIVKSLLYQSYIDTQLLNSNSLPSFYDFLLSNLDNTSNAYITQKFIFDAYFNSVFSLDQGIRRISVYKKKDNTVYQNTKSIQSSIPYEDYQNKEYLMPKDNLLYTDIKTSIYPSKLIDLNTVNATYSYSLSIPLIKLNSDEFLGVLIIDFKTKAIAQFITQFNQSLDGEILILLKTGDVIYDSFGKYYEKKYPHISLLNNSWQKVKIDRKNFYITSVSSSYSSVIIASIISQDTLLKNTKTIQYSIFLATFFCVIFCILIMFISSKNISRRMKIIIASMKEIRSGNFQRRIPIARTNDEFNEIALSFNKMSEHLTEYIERVYASDIKQKNSKLKQKSAELLALQAQINPHFLYNTLEAIRMRAVLDGSNDAGEMIYLLSELFRKQIKGSQVIKIEEEIQYCELYLNLFKIRYSDAFSYEISINDSNIPEYGIIKHILQPVVENYIVHGFDISSSDNCVTINVFKSGDDLCFDVIDNGKGITLQALSMIQEGFKTNNFSQNESIGLKNVNERIKLVFGEAYGLSISSIVGKGTKVTLRIPAFEQEELMKYVESTAS